MNKKTVQDLHTKVEELQQESVRVKPQLSSRDHYMEQRFQAQEREIISLKRKGCQSCKVTISAPKQARRSDLNKQAAPAIPEAAPPAVAQQATLTLEEVEMEVEDIRDAGSFQAFLDVRGKDIHSEQILNTALFYNWKANGSQTPIKKAKTMPMLERMKIPITMLLQLTSTSLMDIPCLFCRMLYDCNIQGQGVPHYVPQSYRSVALTADLAMEKIRQQV